MADNTCVEFEQLHRHLTWLAPQDQHFLMRLIVELGRQASGDDALTADEKIVQITHEIAPDRVPWVTRRLGIVRTGLPKTPLRQSSITSIRAGRVTGPDDRRTASCPERRGHLRSKPSRNL